MDQAALKQRLIDMGMVRRGVINLRGGSTSDVYFSVKSTFGDPEVLDTYSQMITRQLGANITAIAGMGIGGTALAAAVAIQSQKRLILVRDQAKGHGLGNVIDGYMPGSKDYVAIVDDVLTTGNSMTRTREILSSAGAEAASYHVIIKRGEWANGPAVLALFDATEF